MRFQHLLFLSLFLVILFLPMTNDVFGIFHFERRDENRRFNDSLQFNISKLDQFPKDAELYVNDNFAFRSPLIKQLKTFKYHFFGTTSRSKDLIIGKNKRFFIGGMEREIYEGDIQYDEEKLDYFEKEWLKRKHYFDSLGIAYYLIPCPTALEIYPENLPAKIKKNVPLSTIEQLKRKLKSRLPNLLLDPTSTILSGKKSGNMYYMLDNHWTSKAGFLTAKMVLNKIRSDKFPQLDLTFLNKAKWHKTERDYGYFVDVLGIDGLKESTEELDHFQSNAIEIKDLALNFTKEGVSEIDQQRYFRNPKATNKLKVLVIRDSFGNALYPIFKEAFYETLVIFDSWNYRLNKEIVQSYKPDIVIYVTYQPNLFDYIDPTNWE